MHGMLLGYSFEPRPNSRVFATADSVMTIGVYRFINKQMLALEKKNSLTFRPPPPSRKIGGEGGVFTQASTLATLANSPLYSYEWKRGWS